MNATLLQNNEGKYTVLIDGEKFLAISGKCTFNDEEYVKRHCLFDTKKEAYEALDTYVEYLKPVGPYKAVEEMING
jgi:hypothetical protein